MTPTKPATTNPVPVSDAVQVERERLAADRAELDRLRRAAESASTSSNAATPGGLHGYDPAILSGIRRKPNRRADTRRHAAYDREAAAWRAVREQERRVRVAEHRLDQAERDAAAPCDLDALRKGWLVRDRYGWHVVVRVNAKTVSVETGYSWVNRIDKARIVETRAPKSEPVR